MKLQKRLERAGQLEESYKVARIISSLPIDVQISSPSKSSEELYEYFFRTYFHTMKNIAVGVFNKFAKLNKLAEGQESIKPEDLKEIIEPLQSWFDTLWTYIANFAGHVCDSIERKSESA